MTKETTDDWFDRVMKQDGEETPASDGGDTPASDEPLTEIILTEADLAAMFAPAKPLQGYIYFDERTGAIQGISMGPNDDFAHLGCLEAEPDTVGAFLDGSRSISGWTVVYVGSEPVLVNGEPKHITVRPTNQPLTVVTDSAAAPVQLIAMVPQDDVDGLLVVSAPGCELEAGFDGPIRLVLTRRGHPDDVVAMFEIDATELFTKGEVPLPLDRVLPFEIDIITKPLSSVQYRLQPFRESSRPIALPAGRFEELIRCEPVSDFQNAGLVVELHPDAIRVRLQERGGRFYDRALKSILVAASRPSEPDAILWKARVALDDLRTGPVDISLKHPTGDFDILVSRYYAECFVCDSRHLVIPPVDLFTPKPAPKKPKAGVMISLNRKAGEAEVSLIAGGGKTYLRNNRSFNISISRPEGPEFMLWQAQVDLSNGPQTVTIPREALDQDHVFLISHFYEHAYLKTVN